MRANLKAPVILALLAVSMLTLVSLAIPSVAAATELHVSGPQYGTAPQFVNALTEFSLSGGTDMWYRWDGYDYVPYTGPFSAEAVLGGSPGGAPGLPVPLEGPQTLFFNGSGETPQSRGIYVDNTPPVTVAGFIGNHYLGDYAYIESGTQITLSASDAGSGVAEIRYAIGNAQEVVYTGPFTVSGLGMTTIFYFSLDRLGNREAEKRLTVLVDNDPPVVTIVAGSLQAVFSGNTYVAVSTPISLSIEDISGTASSSYRIDGGSWAAYTGPFTLSLEGERTVSARATDNMGHASAEISASFWVDVTPPTVSVPGSEGGTIHVAYGGKLPIQCTDTGAGNCTLYYSLTGGAPWSTYSLPLTIMEPVNVTYYAVDAVGNAADERTVRVTVDYTVDPVDGPMPWRLYMGAGLIAGGILVLVATFLLGRRPAKKSPERPKKQSKEPEEAEHIREPKRKRRNT